MAKCKSCEKEINQNFSEVSGYCVDCVKEMADDTTVLANMRDKYKKENLLVIIFAAIGTAIGIIAGIASGMDAGDIGEAIGFAFVGIWVGGGLGTGLGFFISGFAFEFKFQRSRGESFGDALKNVFIGGLFFFVLGGVLGVAYFLFLVLRRKSWIKKCNAVIDSEDATIEDIDAYSLGKDINKRDLSRKINIIYENSELTKRYLDDIKFSDKQYRKQIQVVQ